MSTALTITVTRTGEPVPNQIPAGVNEAIAKSAADVYRGHLKSLDGQRANRLGGKRSHFYWNAAQTVTGRATADGAEISINQLGLRQRWLGGDIYPVNARKLAIPARAEAYGVPPKEFPGDLTVIKFRSGAMALVKDEQTHTINADGDYVIRSAARGERRSRKRGIGLVEYWLVDHVYQPPDPSVMPSVETVLDAIGPAIAEAQAR